MAIHPDQKEAPDSALACGDAEADGAACDAEANAACEAEESSLVTRLLARLGKAGRVIGCCISCVNCLRKNAPKAAGFFLLQLLFYAHVVRRPPSSPIWARVRDRLQRSTAASFAGVRWWRLDEPRGAAAVLARNPPKFYVYEDNPYLNWLHPSCDMDGNALLEIPGKSTATFSPLGKTRRPLNSLEIGELPPGVSENQHLGDVALAQLALEKGHPWRTENPEEARVWH